MASGKSLELKKIKRHAPEPMCTCGKPWTLHFRKDGKGMLAKYAANDRHQRAGAAGNVLDPSLSMLVNRAQARQMRKGNRR